MTKTKLIQLIHIAKNQLQMDDDTYRTILEEQGGQSSSKDMGIVALEKVLSHMKRCGFKPKRGKNKGTVQGKLRVLWAEMVKDGIIESNDEKALLAFVRKHAKVDKVEWLNDIQASHLVEILKQWRKRIEQQGDNHD
ncbi:MAG: regulatory protein GemA [Kangiella sp.]|nr:regulatory protein GemA [Kangiella sp.]MCW9029237.1 regulatory protein GemA [Kangiella sp.]